MANNEVTEIKLEDDDSVFVCDNCGAYASRAEDIIHYGSCTPGEAKKWERFYEEANEEEAAFGDNY